MGISPRNLKRIEFSVIIGMDVQHGFDPITRKPRVTVTLKLLPTVIEFPWSMANEWVAVSPNAELLIAAANKSPYIASDGETVWSAHRDESGQIVRGKRIPLKANPEHSHRAKGGKRG